MIFRALVLHFPYIFNIVISYCWYCLNMLSKTFWPFISSKLVEYSLYLTDVLAFTSVFLCPLEYKQFCLYLYFLPYFMFIIVVWFRMEFRKFCYLFWHTFQRPIQQMRSVAYSRSTSSSFVCCSRISQISWVAAGLSFCEILSILRFTVSSNSYQRGRLE